MTKPPEKPFYFIKSSIVQGLEKGWMSFVWLLKIILPVSLITALLVHFGIIYQLDFILTPVMDGMGLPPAAALVIILGFFTGIYGTVGALSVMPFSADHMTLIAIFSLICHNIIQESIVQGNSGLNAFVAAGFRLIMAFAVTVVCARIMGVSSQEGMIAAAGAYPGQTGPFWTMILNWSTSTVRLVLQIFCIIMPLMVFLQLGKNFGVIDTITRMIYPVLRLMGLDRSTGMLWLTACVFGLAYGAAVIVEETRTNSFEKHDLQRLHLSIGINHSMIEDPALFLPLGLSAFWLWIPRLIAAILVAWLYSAALRLRRHHA